MSGLPLSEALGLDRLGAVSEQVLGWASPERSYPKTIVEAAELESGDHLLDVGCGTGVLLAAAAFKEPGAVLVGLDPDEDALEVAARNLAGSGARVELRQGVGEDLPFASATFDVATVTLLLGELPAEQRRSCLLECRRVLKTGGRLFVADWADEPGGLEALAALPVRLIRGLLGGRDDRCRLRDQIMLAGFEPPDRIASFSTLFGTIDLHLAYVPPSA